MLVDLIDEASEILYEKYSLSDMESEDRIAVETTNADFESDPPGYLDNFRDYLSHRTPPALAIGGIVGGT